MFQNLDFVQGSTLTENNETSKVIKFRLSCMAVKLQPILVKAHNKEHKYTVNPILSFILQSK